MPALSEDCVTDDTLWMRVKRSLGQWLGSTLTYHIALYSADHDSEKLKRVQGELTREWQLAATVVSELFVALCCLGANAIRVLQLLPLFA